MIHNPPSIDDVMVTSQTEEAPPLQNGTAHYRISQTLTGHNDLILILEVKKNLLYSGSRDGKIRVIMSNS